MCAFAFRFAAVLATALSPLPAVAIDWSFEGDGTAVVQFSDNVNATANGGESAVGLFLTPVARLSGKTETMDLSFSSLVNVIQYRGVSDRNAKSPALDFNLEKRFERSSLTASANYSRQDTHTSEAEDTGLINTTGTRQAFSVSGGGQYQLTERDTLGLSGGASITSYDIPTFTDFQSYNWQAQWSRQSNELRSFVASLTGTHFRPTGANARPSDTYGFQIGRDWQLTEKIRLDTLGGFRYQKSASTAAGGATSGSGSDGLGTLFNASLTYEGETTSLSGNFSRTVSPSGGGSTLETDAVGVAVNHRMSEFVAVSLSASGSRSGASGAGDSSGRQTWSIQPGIDWTLNENVTMSASVVHSSQTLGSQGAASTNTATITLHVTFP